jgi:type VI secretion system protein ImpM
MSIYVAGGDRAVAGFHGKLPVRGDFVRAGLPSTFIGPWDDWMSRVVAGSQHFLGEIWRAAWFEAPIWRFALSAGICGPGAVLGLFLPSVDRAGRMYPLTLAAVFEPQGGPEVHDLANAGSDFLGAVELAGLDALEHDVEPEILAERVRAALSAAGEAAGPVPPAEAGSTLWWTEGGPRVPNAAFAHAGLPGSEIFAWMLDAHPSGPSEPPSGLDGSLPLDDEATDTEAAR